MTYKILAAIGLTLAFTGATMSQDAVPPVAMVTMWRTYLMAQSCAGAGIWFTRNDALTIGQAIAAKEISPMTKAASEAAHKSANLKVQAFLKTQPPLKQLNLACLNAHDDAIEHYELDRPQKPF